MAIVKKIVGRTAWWGQAPASTQIFPAGYTLEELDANFELVSIRYANGVDVFANLPVANIGGSSETAASVKTKYESNADTNAFTNAHKAAAEAVPNKADKDDAITNGHILRKKAGGSFESAGVTVNDLVFTDPETLADQNTITFTKNFGVMTTNTNRSITAISGVPGGGVALLRVVGTGTLDFNSLTGLRHQGTLTKKATTDYLVKIINAGTTGSPIFYIMDADGGGGLSQSVVQALIDASISALNLPTIPANDDVLYAIRNGAYVELAGVDTVPNAPVITTSLNGPNIEIAITAGFNGGQAITGWHIQHSADGSTGWTDVSANTGNTTTPYVVSGPANGPHYYRVAAINSVGESAWSNADGEVMSIDTTTLGNTVPLQVSTRSTSNQRRGQRLNPAGDGFVNSVTVRHDSAAGNALVAIYADSAGSPGALLGISTTVACVTSGQEWDTFTLNTPVAITRGTKIWAFVVFSSATTYGYYASLGQSFLVTATGYSFPDPAGAGTNTTEDHPIYLNVDYYPSTYNYLVNVDFSTMATWADPTVPDGFTKVGTHGASDYVEQDANGVHFVFANTNRGIKPNITLTSGQAYTCEIEIYSVATNALSCYATAQVHNLFYVGKTTFNFTATGADFNILKSAGLTSDCIIKSIKIWQ